MSRRVNDGDRTGLKLDRFRNSRFEYDEDDNRNDYRGVSYSSPNTLGGSFDENRGRRSGDTRRSQWSGSPFENQREYNWNKRQGWDRYYDQSYDRGNRNHGGAQIGHDLGGHRGRGPRGYKRADDSIYHDVCDTLTMSPDVDASDIEVSVKDGVVFLNGTVSDRGMKKNAELDIENISGVIDVQNLLNFRESGEDLH
jgi:osmotically-inducible protein OsmY